MVEEWNIGQNAPQDYDRHHKALIPTGQAWREAAAALICSDLTDLRSRGRRSWLSFPSLQPQSGVGKAL
jgi:hypothetical protein